MKPPYIAGEQIQEGLTPDRTVRGQAAHNHRQRMAWSSTESPADAVEDAFDGIPLDVDSFTLEPHDLSFRQFKGTRDFLDQDSSDAGEFSQFNYVPNNTYMANVDANALRELFRYDFAALVLTLLSEEEGIEHGVPDFHEYIASLMASTAHRICIAIPRDHAKTTIAKIMIIWHLLFTPTRFVVYMSNTTTIAANAMKDVAAFIRHPVLAELFGQPVFSQAAEATGNYTLTWCGKTIVLRALGALQQVRGLNVDNKRPDLAVVDDIERADEDEKNKLGYEPLKRWFYGTFMKAMDQRRNKIIQIGNLVNTRTILNDHLRSPTWRSVRLGAFTSTGKVLWPARWTLDKLRDDFTEFAREGQASIWLAEMMNMPVSESHALLPLSMIQARYPPSPTDPHIVRRCITVDPAISKAKYTDNSVAVVHIQDRAGVWMIADMVAQRNLGPYELFAEIIKLALKWRVSIVGIEATAYQQSLIHIAQVESRRLGYKHFQFLPLTAKGAAKNDRILTWAGMLRKGDYVLTINDMPVLRQLQNFSPASNNNQDDIIDACAYIVQMNAKYSEAMLSAELTGNPWDEYGTYGQITTHRTGW